MSNILITILILGAIAYFIHIQKYKKRVGKYEMDLSDSKQKNTFLDGQLQVLRNDLSETKQKAEASATSLNQSEGRLIALETKYESLQNDQEQLKAEKLSLTAARNSLDASNRQETEKNAVLTTENQHLNESKTDLVKSYSKKIADLEEELTSIREEKEALSREVVALKEQEPIRIAKHDERLTRLNEAQANLEKERERERVAKEKAENDRLVVLRETWSRHEAEVEQKMRLICQEFGIDYIDKEKFPFAGKPDNSVKICGEFVIFDGKSPQGDDLSNFPGYIRTQADQAKKYSKHDDVKKDVFFVVPTTAIHTINETYLALGTHRVHVITIDSLRPILLQLKRIEHYEFAEKLSPEDREKIVTVLGKMAHGMKRRVQIDHFFANEFISILTDAENLPPQILEEARVVERASKLNPNNHTRSKRIEISTLVKDKEKLDGKVAGQQIHTGPELEAIDALPLHKTDED